MFRVLGWAALLSAVALLPASGLAAPPGPAPSGTLADPKAPFAGAASPQGVPAVDTTRVDSIFARWDRPGSPGCALGVTRDGRTVYRRGYGTADLEAGRAIRPETRFYAASVSKQFSAATVMLAARAGHLRLDDSLQAWFPEFPDYGYGTPIRVRDLMHHTSGLRDMYALLELAGRDLEEVTPADVVALLARQADLNFPPGTAYRYSNSGYLLLARLVGRATGRPFADFAREELFEPLEMEATHFHDDASHAIPEMAVGYERSDGSEGEFERAYLPGFTGVGPGGMWTTVGDLQRWDRNFATGRLGGIGFLEQMLARGVLRSGDTLEYAAGLDVSAYKGLSTVGHGGSFMGYRSAVLRFPGEATSVVLLCNLREIDPPALAREVADVVLEDRIRASLRPYVGRYRSEELGVQVTVAGRGPELVYTDARGEERVLEYASRDVFRLSSGATLEFRRDDSGRLRGFRVDAGRAEGMWFERTAPGGG